VPERLLPTVMLSLARAARRMADRNAFPDALGWSLAAAAVPVLLLVDAVYKVVAARRPTADRRAAPSRKS